MKILAVYAGRTGKVGEYMAKLALHGALEAGADEVQLINLRDLDIKPCTGCSVCHIERFKGKRGGCFYKDDMQWLDEQYLSCDGLIVVSCNYENTPPSELKLWMDRLGPSHDVVMVKQASDMFIARGEEGFDERWFKNRPVAFISQGGSEWTTLGMPTMQIIAVPLDLEIVDKLTYSFAQYHMLQEGTAERIKALGKHVAENCYIPREEMKYYGDPGHCPVCHNNVMVLGENANEVICSVCGVEGTIRVENGKIQVTYEPEELKRSHVTWYGKELHVADMAGKRTPKMQFSDSDWENLNKMFKASAADPIIQKSKPPK